MKTDMKTKAMRALAKMSRGRLHCPLPEDESQQLLGTVEGNMLIEVFEDDELVEVGLAPNTITARGIQRLIRSMTGGDTMQGAISSISLGGTATDTAKQSVTEVTAFILPSGTEINAVSFSAVFDTTAASITGINYVRVQDQTGNMATSTVANMTRVAPTTGPNPFTANATKAANQVWRITWSVRLGSFTGLGLSSSEIIQLGDALTAFTILPSTTSGGNYALDKDTVYFEGNQFPTDGTVVQIPANTWTPLWNATITPSVAFSGLQTIAIAFDITRGPPVGSTHPGFTYSFNMRVSRTGAFMFKDGTTRRSFASGETFKATLTITFQVGQQG